jgi:ABC-2 type transport system permease protein
VTLEVPASPSGANPPHSVGEQEAGGPPRAPVNEPPPRPRPPEHTGPPTGQVNAPAAQGHKVTRIVSPTISVRQRLRDIWLSRELLIYLVRTEIKVKYKNSVLGLVWSMVAPAMTLAIYFFVFQVVLGNKMPRFVIFLFAGLLLWNLFSLGVLTGTGVIVNNSGIVKKVSFPREILALAAVGSACVFFFFQALVMIIFMVVLHSGPDWSYMPLALLALVTGIVMACAIAVLLSAINVYLRDTQHLIEVILTAWFWACPIVYAFQSNIAAKLGPRHLLFVYFLNPMTPLVLSFQRFIYAHPVTYANIKQPATPQHPHGFYARTAFDVLPTHGHMWYLELDLGVLAAAVVLFFIALAVFGRLEGNFAEEL